MTDHLLYVAAAGFESARSIEGLPLGHHSQRLHGHSFLGDVRANLPPGWSAYPGGEISTLAERLRTCLTPLNYQHLNRILELPTDENLAHWIHNHLEVPGIQSVGVQSTPYQGVYLDTNGHSHVWRRYLFKSAHKLPNVPPGHKCGRMHGHGFEVIIHAERGLRDSPLSIDYDHLDVVWASIHSQLDHACLNDIPGLDNPTSENISAWIWSHLKPQLPELSWVTVYETSSCGALFDGQHYRIWKEFTLDSAVRLKHAPDGDPCRRIHGNTFTLRLHLHSPLDTVMGWVVDFGDVKEVFNPIFKQLDHQPLHEQVENENADTSSIVQHIKKLASPLISELDRIDLNETHGCGVILRWGEPFGPAAPI